MPVANKNRRYKQRRSLRKPDPWYRKKYNAMELASKAAQGVWYLKGLVNSELKVHSASVNQNIDYNGILDNLTLIAQGDTETTRDGNSIFLRYVNIKGRVAYSSSINPSTVRLMVLIDTSQDPATTTVSDVVAASTTGTVFAPIAPLNKNSGVGRFKILYSKLFTVSEYRPTQAYEINLDLRHHVKYDGATATSLKKGSVYFLQISDKTTDVPANMYYSRVKFHDN